ncbi:S9 family peptidase [Gorillibacterium timonense]|uniref:S9 family peptidase n=1 Tax=Gorillibacterium timonense TaxID=1689269 RepID=UPI00071C76EA|nr:S9 family peptidase [Gorillibacterium timonense]
MNGQSKVIAEDIYHYTWVLDPVVCPVSNTIAYVERSIDRQTDDYRSHIRIVSLDGGESTSFTYGPKDGSPAWSRDGSALLFIRTASQGQQVWSIPRTGGEARQLTSAEQGVIRYALSPDGRYLAYTSKTKVPASTGSSSAEGQEGPWQVIQRTKPRAEGVGLWDGSFEHLYVVDLTNGQVKPLVTGKVIVSQPEWSPDSQKVLFPAKFWEDDGSDPDKNPFQDVYSATIGGDGIGVVKETSSDLFIRSAEYDHEGASILCLGNNRAYHSGTQDSLYHIALENGERIELTTNFDRQLGSFTLNDTLPAHSGGFPLAGPDGAYSLVMEEGSVHVYRFDGQGKPQRCTSDDMHVYQYAFSGEGRYLVVAAATAYHPGDLYRIDLQSKETIRLTAVNEEFLRGKDLAVPQELWVERSGFRLQGWVVKPKNASGARSVPTVLFIHGGPHAMYATSYNHEFQMHAAEGMAVIYMNPRGSFGYGQSFAKASMGDVGGEDYKDLMFFLDAALQLHPELDPARLGLTGGSYGGFMTNWILGRNPRFRAAVTHRSISNWLSLYGTSDIGFEYTETEVGGTPWDNYAYLWERSPLPYIKNIETPLLIVHAEQDYRCPIEQAEQLYLGLKRLNKTVEMIRFPLSNHGMLKSGKPSFRRESWSRTLAWLKDYL